MRAIHLSDLHHAACALRGLPVGDKTALLAKAITSADTADRYRKRLGKSHPEYGHGTLTSALGPVTEPQFCDAAYLSAVQTVVTVLLTRAGH